MARRITMSLTQSSAFINGKWIAAASNKTYDVINPGDGSRINSVPDMDENDTGDAIKCANEAFQTWKLTTGKERSLLLRKWHNLMLENKEELSEILTKENGKPLSDARLEVNYALAFLDWFSEEARRTYGDVIPSPVRNKRMLAIKQPVGVVGAITPWNFPCAMITRKVGAALAAGCSVVLKPAEATPLSALALCALADDAGFPPGVLNIVTCSKEKAPEVGKTICDSTLVSAFSFTGSTQVGKLLMEQCANTVKKVNLELGGHAPYIVFESADIERATQQLLAAKFRATGQACISPNKIIVHESIHDKFVSEFIERFDEFVKIGNGMEDGVTVGPLINSAAVEKVDNQVKDAVVRGANLLRGGKNHPLGPNFYEPTVLTGVTTDMLCCREETFGPLAPILKFKSEEEALTIGNMGRMGLAGYIFSNDIAQIWRMAEGLDVGQLGINEAMIPTVEAPLGGTRESGLGREGSKYGLDEYMELKYLCFGGI